MGVMSRPSYDKEACMATTAVEGLAAAVRGRVVEAGAPDYDEARALYNAMIDKRPAAIAYCVDEKDVGNEGFVSRSAGAVTTAAASGASTAASSSTSRS
jgi:hypothetical protein